MRKDKNEPIVEDKDPSKGIREIMERYVGTKKDQNSQPKQESNNNLYIYIYTYIYTYLSTYIYT